MMQPSLILPVGLCLLPLLAGCGANEQASENAGGEAAAAADLTTVALEIKSGPGAPGTPASRTLTGNFEIRPPHPGEQSIANATTGGACVLAQVPTAPKACTANAECNISPGVKPSGEKTPGFYGYCLSGTCWVKASGAAGVKYCKKGAGEGKHEVPAFYPEEVYSYLASGPGPAVPVSWKVYSCLNGQVLDPKKPPCAEGPGDVMHDEGNPRTVP